MSKPAKDEAELTERIAARHYTERLMLDGARPGRTWANLPQDERMMLVEDAKCDLAAIRAAGWAVMPVGQAWDILVCHRAENARLREALEDLLDDSEVHDFGEWFEDRLKQARAALDPDGQKERRAKALSDLAEMDADLLDIDPEKKP
jgi:hypothetical protein